MMLVGVISSEMICGVGVYADCVSKIGGVVEVRKMMGSFEPAKGSTRGVDWITDSVVGVGTTPQTEEFPQAEIVNEVTISSARMRGILDQLYLY